MSISDGLPESRDQWPPEVLAASALFACGDVVANPPYFYAADPKFGVMQRTREYYDDAYAGAEVIDAGDYAAPYGVITTQTCDVGEIDFDPPTRPFIGISPVFDGSESLDGSTRSLLRRGRRVGPLLHLPALSQTASGFWVADFRLEIPVEKSWLVGRDPIKGFESEEAARLIPRVLNDIRARPAWATVINECVERGMRSHLNALQASSRDVYERVLVELDEIGARADSMLTPTTVQLAAFTRLDEVEAAVRQWWEQAASSIGEELELRGVTPLPPELLRMQECPVTTYEQFAPVTLGGKYSPQ